MELKIIDGYYVDENNNRWKCDKYLKREAIYHSKNLLDCHYCTDCEKCIHCAFCTNCEKCENCYKCKDCYKCICCNNCTNCHECCKCNDCHTCYYCTYCNFYVNCANKKGNKGDNMDIKSEKIVLELERVYEDDIIDGKFIVPSNVTKIMDFAFWILKKLEHIIIPNTVEICTGRLFLDCPKLNKITIQNEEYTNIKLLSHCLVIIKSEDKLLLNNGEIKLYKGDVFKGIENGKVIFDSNYVVEYDGVFAIEKNIEDAIKELSIKLIYKQNENLNNIL